MAKQKRQAPKPQRRELEQKRYIPKLMAMPADKVRRRWKVWLPRLTGQVMELYRQLSIYHEVVSVVKANPAALKPPVFFIWLRDNYVTAIAMGIRRQLDCDYRSISLGRLLREVEHRPELISRRSYRAMMRRKGLSPVEADEMLRRRIGPKAFTAAIATRDIRRVERAEERIRKLVNKRIAHTGVQSALRKPPTFQQIEHAVEEIDQIFVKYDAIIGGGGLTTARAAMLNWSRVLEIPWITPAQRDSIERYPGPRHNQLGLPRER